ncbi:hypothetical protein QQP08_009842 [Theobroma cacao]|nr:hypothetical protein QQP08_009842 [Theobroma cacao]
MMLKKFMQGCLMTCPLNWAYGDFKFALENRKRCATKWPPHSPPGAVWLKHDEGTYVGWLQLLDLNDVDDSKFSFIFKSKNWLETSLVVHA